MQINNINKVNDNFGCFTTLYAEDLNRFGKGINDIIDALDEISNYINNHEESWSESGGGSGTPSNLNYPLSSINRMGSGVSPGQMIYFNGNSWIYKDYKELPLPLSELYTTTFPSNLNGIYSLVYDQSSENKGWKLLDYQNTPGSGLNTNSIADKLNNITNPGSGSSRKVLVWNYNNDNTWTLQDYSSQTSPTTGLTWDDLSTVILSTTELLIDVSHLQRALTQALSNYVTKGNLASNKYKWWGQSLSGNDNDGYTVTGSLRGGIDYIEFANGVRIGVYPTGATSGDIIQVYRSNGDAAHIFATGGVSALGNSPSGGGGQGSSLPDGQRSGLILVWDGDSWEPQDNNSGLNNVLSELNVNSLPGNTDTSYIVTKNSDDPAYEFLKFLVVGTSENNQLVLTNIILGDDNYSIPVSQGVVYSTLTSGNHSSDSSYVIKGSGYTGSQTNATKFLKEDGSWSIPENTTYSKATSSNLGLIRLGNDNLISSSSDNVYPIQLDSYDKAYVYVPWVNTNTTYQLTLNGTTNGSGTSLGSLYAPTSKGNEDQILIADNSGIPTWANQSSLNVGIAEKLGTSSSHLTGAGSASQPVYFSNGVPIGIEGALDNDINGNAATATKFKNSRILWGQIDEGNTSIGYQEGSTIHLAALRNVDDIVFGDGTTFPSIRYKISLVDVNVFLLDKNEKKREVDGLLVSYNPKQYNNVLDIGWGSATTAGTRTRIWGSEIVFAPKGNETIALDLTTSGQIYLPLATTDSSGVVGANGAATGLRIGNAVLYWDNGSKALALQSYDDQGQLTTGNFYATGGVSALGFSNGVSSIDAMAFGNLTVNNQLKMGEDVTLLNNGNWLLINGVEGVEIDNELQIGGNITCSGVTLDDDVTLLYEDPDLILRIGNTSYKITKTVIQS